MKEIDTICSFCGRPARELTDIISGANAASSN